MIVASMRAILFFIAICLFGQAQPPDPAKPVERAKPADIDALLKTAHVAYRKADYAAARKSYEEAWAAAGELPQNDPKRYEILKDLSGVLSASGEYDAAENYIELAINWRENAVGREDPLIAGDLIELATICARRKDSDRAIAILQRVVGIHTKTRGNFENSDVADDISRIALVQLAQNKPDAAIPTLLTAIGIREKVLGADSPGLLAELDRLGSAQITTRTYADAETTFRRALVIRERIEGSQSPDLLTTLDGLAYSLFGEKQYDQAEIFYKRLLNLWLLIGNLPMIADTDEKIAVFYREQKKWDEGTEAAANAIALRALVSAVGLSTEATAWISHGDKAHAIELYKKALTLLDPNRKDHDGLRDQIQHVLADLDAPKATKAVPRKKQP
jgi:tetratricopeptide (TPR) repeat protein